MCDWTLLFLIWVHDEKQGDSRRQLVKLKEPADFIFTRVFHSNESNSSSGNDQNYILSIGKKKRWMSLTNVEKTKLVPKIGSKLIQENLWSISSLNLEWFTYIIRDLNLF